MCISCAKNYVSFSNLQLQRITSTEVQAYVDSTKRSVTNAGSDAQSRREDEQKKQQKLARKQLQKAKKAEQAMLFDEALSAVSKKGWI